MASFEGDFEHHAADILANRLRGQEFHVQELNEDDDWEDAYDE